VRGYSDHVCICVLSVAATITLLAGCTGSSPVAPNPAPLQGRVRSTLGHSAVNPFGALNIDDAVGHNTKGFYACPATGPIEYLSEATDSVVSVYAGKFAGQAPCGQMAGGLNGADGLYVDPKTHDLYVANSNRYNIFVYHRGQTTPYNVYTDPTGQIVVDVTVAEDGTVIASNEVDVHAAEYGSLSTWHGGPNGGTFVGNFPMKDPEFGWFLTARENGVVYFDEVHGSPLWFVSCPAGACGVQTRVRGASFHQANGLATDASGDLLVTEAGCCLGGPGRADTFELPNLSPSTFALAGNPAGMAINKLNSHWFVADPYNNDAAEYTYPNGRLIGTVPGIPYGSVFGIAVDP
jgi:hypothetical protein